MMGVRFMFRVVVPLCIAWLCMVPVQGGILSGAAREAFELIARKAGKEATEQAAEKTAKRLLQESGSEAARTLVKKYGVHAPRLVCNPSRVKLLDELGDDAAKAMLKHGTMAERLLLKSPDVEMARFISAADTKSVRQMEILFRRCAPAPKDEATLLRFVAKHPKLVAYPTLAAAGLCGGYLWAHQHEDSFWGRVVMWGFRHPGYFSGLLLAAGGLLSLLWCRGQRRVLRWFLGRFTRKSAAQC